MYGKYESFEHLLLLFFGLVPVHIMCLLLFVKMFLYFEKLFDNGRNDVRNIRTFNCCDYDMLFSVSKVNSGEDLMELLQRCRFAKTQKHAALVCGRCQTTMTWSKPLWTFPPSVTRCTSTVIPHRPRSWMMCASFSATASNTTRAPLQSIVLDRPSLNSFRLLCAGWGLTTEVAPHLQLPKRNGSSRGGHHVKAFSCFVFALFSLFMSLGCFVFFKSLECSCISVLGSALTVLLYALLGIFVFHVMYKGFLISMRKVWISG